MHEKIINIDPEILSGTPVFNGTRIPVKILFDYVKAGESLEDFLENYPSITKEHMEKVLNLAGKIVSSGKYEYEDSI
ncbi:MAG: DUF433 domain-containing protein [Bacteroidetes bacterium]|nr:DUF433 domain-containing protein [Bacteroidota bacterium]MBX7044702.1 DUF433 domain-containing protein [Ignavibacteria bacterium]